MKNILERVKRVKRADYRPFEYMGAFEKVAWPMLHEGESAEDELVLVGSELTSHTPLEDLSNVFISDIAAAKAAGLQGRLVVRLDDYGSMHPTLSVTYSSLRLVQALATRMHRKFSTC